MSDPSSTNLTVVHWRAATKKIIPALALCGTKTHHKTFADSATSIKGPEKERLIYIEQDIYLPELTDSSRSLIGIDEDPLGVDPYVNRLAKYG
ncbi:hypothetical protein O9929_18540 [Vibrio lentus]|nr:hypothetical protein [Vibrio lentus]